jgi:hypothetical protein
VIIGQSSTPEPPQREGDQKERSPVNHGIRLWHVVSGAAAFVASIVTIASFIYASTSGTTILPPTAGLTSTTPAPSAGAPSASATPPAATTPSPRRPVSPSSTAAPADAVLSGNYQLYNTAMKRCLGERLPKDSKGNTITDYTQEGCQQARTLTITGTPGHYRFTDLVQHGCVAPKPNNLAHEENPIKPIDCNWSPATVVEWDLIGTSTVKIISRTDPTRCLTAKNVTAGLAYLRMYGCGAANLTALQQWTLRKVP